MRILLIVLLFLIALAQVAAALPILTLPQVAMAAKAAPLVMALGAVLSAFLLIRKSTLAFLPYVVAYAIFLGLTAMAFGVASLPKAGLGLVIGLLFLLPSVRKGKR